MGVCRWSAKDQTMVLVCHGSQSPFKNKGRNHSYIGFALNVCFFSFDGFCFDGCPTF